MVGPPVQEIVHELYYISLYMQTNHGIIVTESKYHQTLSHLDP